MDFHYLDILRLLLPETILTGAGLAALAVDLLWMREKSPGSRHTAAFVSSALGCLAAGLCVLPGHQGMPGLEDWLVTGGLAAPVRLGLIVLALLSLVLLRQTGIPRHSAETHFLLLCALVGLLLMASAQHLLLAFLALELSALSLYALVALDRKGRWTAEGALKYFLPGGVATAFTLFGLSLLYGSGGSLTISGMADPTGDFPLVLAGTTFLALGFGFKIAAVPMHSWAPDVYQSAMAPVAGLIASASKLAGFYLFARIWTIGLASRAGSPDPGDGEMGWQFILVLLAALSLLVGNLVALAQRRIRPLLAWSAVAHSGLGILGILAASDLGTGAMLYHLFTYGLTILGLFALVHLVERDCGSDHFASLHHFHRRYPLEAFCLALFVLSLAGIPPLAGFYGKFGLFAALLRNSAGAWHSGLAVMGILLSTLSLYYYLHLIKQAYVVETEAGTRPVVSAPLLRGLVAVLAAAVLILGCFPQLLWSLLQH